MVRKTLLAALFIVVIWLQSAQAQVPPEGIRAVVQEFLLEQLGRDAVVLEWRFEGVTWENNALGCPQEGGSYDDTSIAGYRWYFLMDDGIRYALHTDLSGGQIVLCQQTSEADLAFSTYGNNSFFSIQHPNLWTARPVNGQTEVLFSFRGEDSCNLPFMRVLVVGNVADVQSLLDSYLAGNTGTFAPFGESGLAVTHPVLCDNIPHMRRATALLGSTNTAFLIVQSAPVNVFTIWAPVFTEMLVSFAPGSGSLVDGGANVGTVAAPDAPSSSGASDSVPQPPASPEIDMTTIPLAHVFVGDVYIGRLNDLPGFGVTVDAGQVRANLRTSSDGQQLAYIENETNLFTVSLHEPGRPNLLSDQAAAGFPPSWALDAPALAYLSFSEDDALEIHTVYPDNTRETVGRIPFDNDCAAESDYVVDQLYWRETGANGNALTFVWLSENRFLYTPNCNGVGLAIFDAAADSMTELDSELRRAAISPDRTKLAALKGDGLVIVDLSTLEVENVPTQRPPDQLVWDATGTQIYYSSLFAAESLIWDDADTQLRALDFLGVFPFESRLNTISILQIDTQNAVEALLWEGTGFAVGQIVGAPDGSGILFSLIPSDRGLLTNFANRAEPQVIRNSVPETQLYWLPVDFSAAHTEENAENPNAQLLAISGQPAFAAPRWNRP